jgi:CP family cyanate transporter-like MFS transporter
MALGAALAPAASGLLDRAGVPLKGTMLIWAVLPLLACWYWITANDGAAVTAPVGDRPPWSRLTHSPQAWALTAFFGLQATLFFLVVTWLPQYYRGQGHTAVGAGLALAVFTGTGMLDSWFVPQLAARLRSCVPLAVGLSMLGAAGFGLLALGAPGIVAVLCLGLGQAGIFPLALMLFTLRAPDVRSAEALSTMAQGVGFVAAAIGLVGVSYAHAWHGSWDALWFGLAGVAIVQAVVGILAASSGPVTADVGRVRDGRVRC